MFIYIIVFALTTLIAIVIDAFNRDKIKKQQKKRLVNILYVILLVIFVVFVGCRDISVGSDSISYLYKFENAKGVSFEDYILLNLTDPVFYTLTWIIQRITNSVNLYFIIISLLFFATYVFFILKYSTSVGWSIWLLNSLGFTTFAMSTLRQSVAMAFCIIAYMLYVERKKTAWVMMLFAISSHLSAIIFTPMMFVSYFAHNKKPWKLIIVICTIVLAAPSLMKFIMLLEIKDGRYSEATEVGGVGMIIFLIILLVIGFYTYYIKKKGNLPITYYYEYIAIGFAFCSFIISRFDLAAMRLFWYYLSFALVFIPNVLNSMSKPMRAMWMLILGLVTFYYLFYRVMSDPYENSRLLLPYRFFW